MVEFALILPVLLLIIWGIVDVTRAFQAIDSLASAVRQGARLAAVASNPSADPTPIQDVVIQDFTPLGPPLTQSEVQVSWAQDATGSEDVTVTANYPFQALTPLLWAFTITRTATFRWELTTGP